MNSPVSLHLSAGTSGLQSCAAPTHLGQDVGCEDDSLLHHPAWVCVCVCVLACCMGVCLCVHACVHVRALSAGSLTEGVPLPTELVRAQAASRLSQMPYKRAPHAPTIEYFFWAGHVRDRSQPWLRVSHTGTHLRPVR